MAEAAEQLPLYLFETQIDRLPIRLVGVELEQKDVKIADLDLAETTIEAVQQEPETEFPINETSARRSIARARGSKSQINTNYIRRRRGGGGYWSSKNSCPSCSTSKLETVTPEPTSCQNCSSHGVGSHKLDIKSE